MRPRINYPPTKHPTFVELKAYQNRDYYYTDFDEKLFTLLICYTLITTIRLTVWSVKKIKEN